MQRPIIQEVASKQHLVGTLFKVHDDVLRQSRRIAQCGKDKLVVTGPAGQSINALPAVKPIVAIPAEEPISPSAPEECVVARFSEDTVAMPTP